MQIHSLCLIIIGFYLDVVAGVVLHPKPRDETLRNKTTKQNDLRVHIEAIQSQSDVPYHVPPMPESATPGTETGIKVVPHEDDSWKNVIIIACTVMASVEIVIVAFMVTHWKRIRWHLRKMNCPCCASHDNRGRHQDHQAVEMEERESFTNNVTTTVHSDAEDIVEISIVQRSSDVGQRQMDAPPQTASREQTRSRSQHCQNEEQTADLTRGRGRELRSPISNRNRDLMEAGPSHVDIPPIKGELVEAGPSHVDIPPIKGELVEAGPSHIDVPPINMIKGELVEAGPSRVDIAPIKGELVEAGPSHVDTSPLQQDLGEVDPSHVGSPQLHVRSSSDIQSQHVEAQVQVIHT